MASIDRDLVAGMSMRAVARKYGLSSDAVHRHSKAHISEEQRRDIAVEIKRDQALAVADELNGEAVEIKGGLARIVRELELILNKAKVRGDDPLALVSLRELRTTLLDLAKVYGGLKSELTVNVNLNDSPQWLQLRDVLLGVFEQHPAAKQEFIERARFLRLDHAG
ncbi:hypothetical protein [Sandarakinorhabdus sp.]|uniref:hypothetical protein n=1 Tax=Sandarakinorhabdus sp. TaxID=1916663 RepID=UPI003F7017B1